MNRKSFYKHFGALVTKTLTLTLTKTLTLTLTLTMTLTLALTTTLTMTSCGGKGTPNDSVPHYELQTLKPVNQQMTLQIPAILKGDNDVAVYPETDGRITGIFYENGDLVHKGQKLFTIESSEEQMAVVNAKASIASAQANLASAKLNLDSQKELFEQGVVSDYVYRTAKNQYTAALSQLTQAKAQMTIAKTRLSYCTVVSPVDGVVNGRDYNIGTLVSPSMAKPLTTVSVQSVIVAQFSIPEAVFSNLAEKYGFASTPEGYKSKPGKKMYGAGGFELIMNNGQKYSQKGTFRSFSGMVDDETGSMTCYVNFPNQHGQLHSGNSATIIITTEAQNVFIIPQSACKKIQDKLILYKVGKDNLAESVVVDVYPTDDGEHYIITGSAVHGNNAVLKAGDEILTAGVSRITDGTRLK